MEAGRRARQMDPKRLDTGSRQIHSVRCGKDLRRIVRGGCKRDPEVLPRAMGWAEGQQMDKDSTASETSLCGGQAGCKNC